MSNWDMPPKTRRGFEPIRGAWVILRLLADERLPFENTIHPAGVVGNLGGESGLDPGINEIAPTVQGSRGGHGWEQATGPRRAQLEEFGAARGDPFANDDETNYEFLVSELLGSEHRALERLLATTTLEAAVYTFEVAFERPSSTSDVNSRIKFAQQAIAAMGAIPIAVRPPPATTPEPVVQAVAPSASSSVVIPGTADMFATTIWLLQEVAKAARYYTGPIDGVPNNELVEAMEKYGTWLESAP